jgi:hypothetical protein
VNWRTLVAGIAIALVLDAAIAYAVYEIVQYVGWFF